MLEALEEYYRDKAQAYQQRAEAKAQEVQAYEAQGTDRDRRLDRARQLEALADRSEYDAESELLANKARQLGERRERMQAREGQSAVVPPRGSPSSEARIQPGDRLMIQAANVFDDQPIAQEYIIERSGTVPLGPTYGRAPIAGLTVAEAEQAIEEQLGQFVRDPQVQVTRVSSIEQSTLDALRAEIQSLRSTLEKMHGEFK
jgi:hypothetical protein